MAIMQIERSAIQKQLDEHKIMMTKSGEEVTYNVTFNINKIIDEKFATLEENTKL